MDTRQSRFSADMSNGAGVASTKVRIDKTWATKTLNGKEFFQFNMILLRQNGEQIHAIISKNQYEDHKEKLKDQNIIIMTDFLVSIFNGNYRPVPGNLRLHFTDQTSINVITEDDGGIPLHKFNFTPIEDILKLHAGAKTDNQDKSIKLPKKTNARYPFYLNKIPTDSDDIIEMEEFIRNQDAERDLFEQEMCFDIDEQDSDEQKKKKYQEYQEYKLLQFRVQQKYELIRFEEYQTMEKDWNGVTFNEFLKLN